MRYEFFKSNLMTKFIKNLLANTPLPLYPIIEDSQFMIEGVKYIYKNHVLNCTKSGTFIGEHGNIPLEEPLTVSENITVTDNPQAVVLVDPVTKNEQISPLVITDKFVRFNTFSPASFEIVDDFYFGMEQPHISAAFKSNTTYYDSLTHRNLGKYLRLIRNQFDIDLLPLYNCFAYDVVDNLKLTTKAPYVVEEANEFKTMLIPIQFNKKYTIAFDSAVPVLMKAVIYRNGLIYDSLTQKSITDELNEKVQKINNCQFSKPFIYELNSYSKDMFEYEKYLHLAIQLPIENNTSLVVIEGDYSSTSESHISDISCCEYSSTINLSRAMTGKLSLLQLNDNQMHPFADKLIAYLLDNTIDDREQITNNVTAVENKINFKTLYKGQWDNKLRYALYSTFMALNRNDINKIDILGYVDSDVENAMNRGYLDYGK